MSERKIEVEYESYNRQELLLQSKRITAIVKNDEENLVNIKILGWKRDGKKGDEKKGKNKNKTSITVA